MTYVLISKREGYYTGKHYSCKKANSDIKYYPIFSKDISEAKHYTSLKRAQNFIESFEINNPLDYELEIKDVRNIMNKDDFNCLIGKYLNGYKIVKVDYDPFIKGQVNLLTNDWEYEAFNDRSLVKFHVRSEDNSSKMYKKLVDEENFRLKQALKDIGEYIRQNVYSSYGLIPDIVVKTVQEKIDKALGGNHE